LKLERALREYEKKKNEIEKRRNKLKDEYSKKVSKSIGEILKYLEKLEKKEIPKNIDERIKKIAEVEKRNYVETLRRTLTNIKGIDDLGKFLPELSKFHVGHGKYLLIVFEKDIFTINKHLKSLSTMYSDYLRKLESLRLENIPIKEILDEMGNIKKSISIEEKELERLKADEKTMNKRFEELMREKELEKLENEIKELKSRLESKEIEIRSKVSQLKRPIKRSRIGEKVAKEIIKDSAYAITHPEEFLEFLNKMLDKFEGKYRKTAEWLIENLNKEVEEIRTEREELSKLEDMKKDATKELEEFEREIKKLKEKIKEREEYIKRLKKKLLDLENELQKSISRLESLLKTKINFQ
jgi:chromosome segregation ATPase